MTARALSDEPGDAQMVGFQARLAANVHSAYLFGLLCLRFLYSEH